MAFETPLLDLFFDECVTAISWLGGKCTEMAASAGETMTAAVGGMGKVASSLGVSISPSPDMTPSMGAEISAPGHELAQAYEVAPMAPTPTMEDQLGNLGMDNVASALGDLDLSSISMTDLGVGAHSLGDMSQTVQHSQDFIAQQQQEAAFLG